MYDPNQLPSVIQDAYSGCTALEKKLLRQILKELADWGESPTYEDVWLADYNEIPVSINTFLDSDTFLGKVTRNGSAIYPTWREAMNDVFNSGNKYEEVALTGATRIGKTSTAITMTAYMLYRLMCLKDPQEFFHKKDVSKFSIMFFNVTKDLAKGVAFREFNDTLKESPWFCNHGGFSKSEKDFYYIPDGNKINVTYGSDVSHSLGAQIFVGFMDEMAFAKSGIKDVKKAKANMKELYDSVNARIKGTFRQGGEVYGKLFAVSSKKSDSDFMEYYIQNQKSSGKDEHMYVVDKPQWEVLPESMFSSKKFYIAVGNKNQKGRVVPESESTPEGLESLRNQGFKLLTPPIDMLSDFKSDFDIALRDLAGISVPGTLSFITSDIIDKCVNTHRRNPFTNTVITTGTKDNLTIEEFWDMSRVDVRDKHRPMFIHLDLSLNDDLSGLGGVWISGRKDIKDPKLGNIVSVPTFKHAFSVDIEAPRGANIAYDKVVNFILWLRQSGFNISGVSRDQFQSEYVGQQLEANGIEVDKLSLDRTPDGYLAFRSVLSEERIDMLPVEELKSELIHLQRDGFSGKIDHPVGGSKDLSDGLAGCVWNAIKKNPSVPVESTKTASVIKAVNGRSTTRRSAPGANLPSMLVGGKPNRR